jgi:hypothetical protein
VWVAELTWSLDGGQTWNPSTPTQLFPPATLNGSLINPELVNRDLFCAPDLGVNLATWNSSGTARDSAYVTCIAFVTLRT